MPAVRKMTLLEVKSGDFMPTETFLLTLTKDETATMCKASLHWNVKKEKALELIINGGMIILREVLPFPGIQRPPEFH